MQMTAQEWLRAFNRKPYQVAPDDPAWYWGQEKLFNPHEPHDHIDDEIDFLLPDEVFNNLKEKITYPDVKCYDSLEDAIEDYEQAFNKAVAQGWTPCSTLKVNL